MKDNKARLIPLFVIFLLAIPKPAGNILAVIVFIAASLTDLFDGKIARTKKNRTEQMKKFGVQIDSLSDLAAFGILPACIGIAMLRSSIDFYNFPDIKFLHLADKSAIIKIVLTGVAVLYALAALIRLAYFNVLEEERSKTEKGENKIFIGLPVTTAALIFPTILLIHIFCNANLTLLYFIFLAIVGYLFISRIQVKKPTLKGVLIMISVGLLEAGILAYIFIVMKN